MPEKREVLSAKRAVFTDKGWSAERGIHRYNRLARRGESFYLKGAVI